MGVRQEKSEETTIKADEEISFHVFLTRTRARLSLPEEWAG